MFVYVCTHANVHMHVYHSNSDIVKRTRARSLHRACCSAGAGVGYIRVHDIDVYAYSFGTIETFEFEFEEIKS